MRTFKEELGHDNEWGRPEMTKKMLAATPGQRIEVLHMGTPDAEFDFPLKKKFLELLRNRPT